MHPIWSGSVSFGLINIPVRLYSGTQEHAIDLDMLHKTDLSPIRYARICKADNKEVPYKDIVKGYEYQKGDYVVVTDEDFQKVSSKKSKTIEIIFFTAEEEVDSIYFDKLYYLQPDKGGAKAYALLREALRKSGKVAVAVFTLRNHQHMAVIKAKDNALILNQLRYHSEIRSSKELELPEEKGNPKELEVAIKLIDQLTEHFDPKNYHDNYLEELQKVIDAKVKGKQVKKKRERAPTFTASHDILSKLQASLRIPSRKRTARMPAPKRRIKKKTTA